MKLLPTCQEVEAHLTDFTEGTLPWKARLGIRLHLLMCRSCAAFLRGFRVLPVLAKLLLRPASSPPPESLRALQGARNRLHPK
jgi:hypothetical protein